MDQSSIFSAWITSKGSKIIEMSQKLNILTKTSMSPVWLAELKLEGANESMNKFIKVKESLHCLGGLFQALRQIGHREHLVR